MTEDPELIRLNIRHYQELLKLQSNHYSHHRLRALLAEAEGLLPLAEAEALERKA